MVAIINSISLVEKNTNALKEQISQNNCNKHGFYSKKYVSKWIYSTSHHNFFLLNQSS